MLHLSDLFLIITFLNMSFREKREIKSLLVKFGAALAISLAGFLYSRFRNTPRSPGRGKKIESRGISQHVGDSHASSSLSTRTLEEEAYTEKTIIDESKPGLSPRSRYNGNEDGVLLPDFNDLVKEFDLVATSAGYSLKNAIEPPATDSSIPKALASNEKSDYEQEIRYLRNMVRILEERERYLEVRLVEYYGLKEQETAVIELQNRLKKNNMEAKLLTFKIESLQADNQKLEAELADQQKIVAELTAARSKVRLLKKKLRSEAQENKEQILSLQKRVARLYELRNYQPDSGKTVARDLIKTLSPKSEEKAKQLILEYAQTEGLDEKGLNLMNFDSDQWSSSQTSFTDSGDLYESSVDNSSATKTNTTNTTNTSSRKKFLYKLRRLIQGKHKHQHNQNSPAQKSGSSEDWDSPGCSLSTGVEAITELQTDTAAHQRQLTSRHSLDIQQLRSLKFVDVGDVEPVRRNSDVGREGSNDLSAENQLEPDTDSAGKSDLIKFAEALKGSRRSKMWFRKSASCNFD
ncbi:protein CHUP1, chloroplastic-like [Carica papaya]|uniref:protein CHUP1, chloroplastic-like n=1 Tax=Carica papaya TaxID=3649 RepID=UPI000B8CE4C2|nr:protein CHUP1, chloroplastic-like [Carica papaya]